MKTRVGSPAISRKMSFLDMKARAPDAPANYRQK
jgi:hypothetical protein